MKEEPEKKIHAYHTYEFYRKRKDDPRWHEEYLKAEEEHQRIIEHNKKFIRRAWIALIITIAVFAYAFMQFR